MGKCGNALIPFIIPILWPVYDVMDKQRGRARSKTKEAERVVQRTAGSRTIRFEAVFRVDNNPLPFRTDDVRMAQLGVSTRNNRGIEDSFSWAY